MRTGDAMPRSEHRDDYDWIFWWITVELAVTGGVIFVVGLGFGIAIGAWLF